MTLATLLARPDAVLVYDGADAREVAGIFAQTLLRHARPRLTDEGKAHLLASVAKVVRATGTLQPDGSRTWWYA